MHTFFDTRAEASSAAAERPEHGRSVRRAGGRTPTAPPSPGAAAGTLHRASGRPLRPTDGHLAEPTTAAEELRQPRLKGRCEPHLDAVHVVGDDGHRQARVADLHLHLVIRKTGDAVLDEARDLVEYAGLLLLVLVPLALLVRLGLL